MSDGPIETRIGEIGNYYGGLSIKRDGERRYWSIENYDGHGWDEIPADLYDALLNYESARLSSLIDSAKEAK